MSDNTVGSMGTTITDGNKTLINTKSMGMDIGAIVKDQIKVKEMPLETKKDAIEQQTKVIAAFSEMESKVVAIKTAAAKLSNLSAISGSTSAFGQKRAMATATTTGTLAGNIVGFTVTDNTPNQNFSLSVQNIATADTLAASSASATTLDSALNQSGTFALASLDNSAQTITITADMTLVDIKNAINSASSLSKIRASIIPAGSNDFRLNISHTETGKQIFLNDPDSILSNLNLSESGATDQSLSACVIFNGIQTYHSKNMITNLVEGVTIEPLSASAGNVINVKIEPDLNQTKKDIAGFVNAYNDFVDFFDQQHVRDEDDNNQYAKDSYLARNSFFDLLNTSISSAMSGSSLGVPNGELRVLADIGITFDADSLGDAIKNGQSITNKLKIDDNILDSKLLNSIDQVRKLFAFEAVTSNAQFIVSGHPQNISKDIAGTPFTVTISNDSGIYTATFTSGTTTLTGTVEDVDGNLRIVAPDEGIFQGIKMAYLGSQIGDGSSATTTVTLIQGIGDKLNNYLETLLLPNGSLDLEKEQLKGESTLLKDELLRLTDRFNREKEFIIAKFAKLQEVLRQLEFLKENLTGYMGALASKSR